MAAIIDLKEIRTEARRTQILMGAAQVFAQKGFHQATIKEIARAAGVAEGTIYNYFNNKRELLVAMIEALATSSLKALISEHPPDDSQAFLTAVLRDRFQLAQERGYLLAPILAELFTDVDLRQEVYNQIAKPLTAYMEQYWQVHIDAGRIRPLDPVIVTRALVGAIMVNFMFKITGLDPRYENVSTEKMMEQLVSLFLSGLLTQQG